ncbi:unnamed protein product [Closterium sp. NIES-53]
MGLQRAQGVHVDPKKIKAVRTWKTPENVKELQQFPGFANYYNRFVPQYAKIATPLTNLLKKNTSFKWEPEWDHDVALRKGSTKIWVPNYPPLRQLLLEGFHDVLYAGHFGSNKTLAGIAKVYYWPHMANDVQKFVTSCDTCQRMKSIKQKKAGLLQPLPFPEQPGKWSAWISSPVNHLPTRGMTPSWSSSTNSQRWDTSFRHIQPHARRKRHSYSCETSEQE